MIIQLKAMQQRIFYRCKLLVLYIIEKMIWIFTGYTKLITAFLEFILIKNNAILQLSEPLKSETIGIMCMAPFIIDFSKQLQAEIGQKFCWRGSTIAAFLILGVASDLCPLKQVFDAIVCTLRSSKRRIQLKEHCKHSL